MILGVLNIGLASTVPVLEPVLGQPMLARQLERLGPSKRMDALVIVTGTVSGNDAVAALCADLQLPCVRSESRDALDRVHEAARAYAPRHVVCLEACRPLNDPDVVDDVIEEHLDGDHDLTCTFPPPSYPQGLDVEVVRFACLEEAFVEAPPPQRGTATGFVGRHPDRYGIGVVSAESDYSRYRWVVEDPEDLERIRRIYASLYCAKPDFSWRDVLALCEHRREWEVQPGSAAPDELEPEEGEISV